MSFSAGDTFVNQSAPHTPTHLWAVISDIQQSVDEIVIVNFTSWRQDKDESCLLDKGDHPHIQHKTYISYRDAHVVTLAKLEELESQSLITRKETLDSDILTRVREGAMVSPFAKLKIRKIMEDQNLV